MGKQMKYSSKGFFFLPNPKIKNSEKSFNPPSPPDVELLKEREREEGGGFYVSGLY